MPEEGERVAVLESRVQDLAKWRDSFSTMILTKLDAMERTIREELSRRPSWAVTLVLTTLASLSVGLIVYVVK